MASRKKAENKSPKRRSIYHPIKSRKTAPAVTVDDVASIDAIVKALYGAISFSGGAEPDWGRLRSLFYPGATLTHAKADKTAPIKDFLLFDKRTPHVFTGFIILGEIYQLLGIAPFDKPFQ